MSSSPALTMLSLRSTREQTCGVTAGARRGCGDGRLCWGGSSGVPRRRSAIGSWLALLEQFFMDGSVGRWVGGPFLARGGAAGCADGRRSEPSCAGR